VGVNGQPLVTFVPIEDAYNQGHPGDPIDLTVERPGEAKPLTLHGIFRAASSFPSLGPSGDRIKSSAVQVTGSFPVLFIVVGFAVLFLRLEDPNAWLLSLLFCGFVAAPNLLNPGALPPGLRVLAFAYRSVFNGLLCSLFYIFFAVFPVRSPQDRRFPWLKWVALLLGVCSSHPSLRSDSLGFPAFFIKIVGDHASTILLLAIRYGLLALGLISLAQSSFSASIAPDARRKARVIFAGTLVGVTPVASR
jgi:hypothetical protein